MKAEEFYANYDLKDTDVSKGDIVISERDLIEVMEAYHQHRVNAISEDDISKTCHLFALPSQAIKWFKNELLKQ